MTTNHTPTDDRDAAIHWAAEAIRLKESRERRGNPLTAAEQAVFDRYQDAARQHGITEAQVREYLRNLPAR